MKRIANFMNTGARAGGGILWLLLLYLLQAVCQAAQPEVLNRAVNAVGDASWDGLQRVVLFAVFVTVGTLAVDALIKLGMVRFSNALLERVQVELTERVMQFTRRRFQQNESPDYLTGVTDHAETAVQASTNAFFDTFSSAAILVVCVLYMAWLSVPLTCIVVAFNIILRLVLTIVEKKIRRVSDACNQVVRENNGFLVELLSNMLTVRVYREQAFFNAKLAEKERGTYRSHIRRNAWWNGQSEFVWCSLKFAEYVLVYGIGGILYYRGYIDFGLFLAYPIAMDYFVKGINKLLMAMVEKNEALSAIDALGWLYGETELEGGRDELTAAEKETLRPGEIRFENVSFSYKRADGSERKILQDISFAIEPGDKVLLQGPNGEGKSTLLYLISGQYRPDGGRILYGDTPIEELSLAAVSENYRLITQENDLFHCDVPSNMELTVAPDREACREVLRKLRMEDRIDMEVSSLSQGEKQRVNIARAIRKNSGRIFLLGDEITANIDPENAENVFRLLEKEFAQDTVILVAHGDCSFQWNRRITVEGGRITVECKSAAQPAMERGSAQ
ncbi:MAG TPA: ABC transporter ATP-binding protein/permease [Candidatus Eisenbergiella merdavium]|uniref:ABC transporter ATP-binding protein/permease n=1 Tax=Candidatus Eisenbergiella merdavium TaxID=2838551 RepID=A0A9D2NEZ1_9FIRM|nr:ABC transporter ATP-binding protein/permease [Candidatus Eisenbergiella merdavium]